MKRYKLLKDCQDGEWVYYDVGELCQVQDYLSTFDEKIHKDLVDGYFRIGAGGDTKVYPLTIHAKVIAESIHGYYKKMHEKNLINGSRWTNWLSEKFDELMELNDNASKEDYHKIYESIESQITELMYHKSFL